MEKSSRSVGTNIFAFLGKPAPISVYHNKGFSGPIVPLIPMEARRSKEKDRRSGSFETEEPTSPKVSCMGQIKHKKMACKLKQRPPPPARRDQKRVSFAVPKIFFRRKARPMHRVGDEEREKGRMVRAPSIARMRRYASGRESALRNFDWKKAEKGSDDDDDDDEEEEEEEEEEEVIIAHSAPLVVGGRVEAPEPRKEVNLWKRRTVAPPIPLRLD